MSDDMEGTLKKALEDMRKQPYVPAPYRPPTIEPLGPWKQDRTDDQWPTYPTIIC